MSEIMITEYTRCLCCAGSGKIIGGGFVMKGCEECGGKGKIPEIKDDIDILIAKESQSYNQAKARIKALDKNMTEDEAEKLLDDELAKLNAEKLPLDEKPITVTACSNSELDRPIVNKRGRPKKC